MITHSSVSVDGGDNSGGKDVSANTTAEAVATTSTADVLAPAITSTAAVPAMVNNFDVIAGIMPYFYCLPLVIPTSLFPLTTTFITTFTTFTTTFTTSPHIHHIPNIHHHGHRPPPSRSRFRNWNGTRRRTTP